MGRVVIHTRKKKARGKKSSLSKEEYQSVIHAFGMLSSVGGASQRRISEAIAHNRNTMYYDVNKEPLAHGSSIFLQILMQTSQIYLRVTRRPPVRRSH